MPQQHRQKQILVSELKDKELNIEEDDEEGETIEDQ